jgi:hypothetical protein
MIGDLKSQKLEVNHLENWGYKLKIIENMVDVNCSGYTIHLDFLSLGPRIGFLCRLSVRTIHWLSLFGPENPALLFLLGSIICELGIPFWTNQCNQRMTNTGFGTHWVVPSPETDGAQAMLSRCWLEICRLGKPGLYCCEVFYFSRKVRFLKRYLRQTIWLLVRIPSKGIMSYPTVWLAISPSRSFLTMDGFAKGSYRFCSLDRDCSCLVNMFRKVWNEGDDCS